jgi:GMP synthase-like glutamine amidotransferase
MAHLMNSRAEGRRASTATRVNLRLSNPLFDGLTGQEQAWMSHRDQVEQVPDGFALLGGTATCPIATMGDESRRLYGVQFHRSCAHAPAGKFSTISSSASPCEDWDPRGRSVARRFAKWRPRGIFLCQRRSFLGACTLCLRAVNVHGACRCGLCARGPTRATFSAMSPRNFPSWMHRRTSLGR